MVLLRNKNKGFTTIEIALSIFITTLVGVAVFAFMKSVIKNSSMFQTNITSRNQIRLMFKNFSSEVRSSSFGFDGSYIIEMAGSSTFTFYSNIDKDKPTEKISYYLNNDKLMKTVIDFNVSTNKYDIGTTTKTVMNYVHSSTSSPIFSYYDSNYDGTDSYLPLSYPVNISAIRLISLKVSSSELGARIDTKEVSEIKASIRNLKDNY